MNRRLQQFLEAENITQAQFASKVKVAPASISHILAGRNKPGFDFIQNTISAFPELNIDWLIMGRGKMYKQASGLPAASSPTNKEYEKEDLFIADAGSRSKNDSTLEGLLFPIDDATTPPELNISAPQPDTTRNIQSLQDEQTRHIITQQPVRQRKATRIMVFYDDGTFQEFR